MWKTGHSLIKSKMKETGAPLAGEMSGHIFFKHRWYGFDDALYASVRLIEAVAKSGKSLTELMDEMPTSVATPELRFPVDEAASSRSSRKCATACRRRRQGRRDRRRPGQHARRLVAAARVQHAGRAGRPRRSLMCTINSPRRR
jgi:phosphomannomutase